jgi:hypothetical protein
MKTKVLMLLMKEYLTKFKTSEEKTTKHLTTISEMRPKTDLKKQPQKKPQKDLKFSTTR